MTVARKYVMPDVSDFRQVNVTDLSKTGNLSKRLGLGEQFRLDGRKGTDSAH
jgi:hypothetical protein